MDLTKSLKAQLWRRFGTPEHPAEWDGRVYGGGKISQRFWEYFRAVELLDLKPGDRVLDIGGGSPMYGLSFFPRLLAEADIEVHVLDTNFGDRSNIPPGVRLIEGLADTETLGKVLAEVKPTKISCVSVLEHATHEQQVGIFQGVENAFQGESFVLTLEFHETQTFFEQCPTTATLSNAVSVLTRYYLEEIDRSPLNCTNAVVQNTRLWYPMALKFVPMPDLARPAAKPARKAKAKA